MATYLIRCVEVGREIQAQRGKLRRDLAAVIGERLPGALIEVEAGRVVVESERDAAAILAALPGVISVSPCVRVARDQVEHAMVELARQRLSAGDRFAVRVRRGNAARTRSLDLARKLGDAVAQATGARIDLTQPDVELWVELRGDDAFVFDRVIAGVDQTGPTVPRAAGEPRFLA